MLYFEPLQYLVMILLLSYYFDVYLAEGVRLVLLVETTAQMKD
jgi:hypothetical protein